MHEPPFPAPSLSNFPSSRGLSAPERLTYTHFMGMSRTSACRFAAARWPASHPALVMGCCRGEPVGDTRRGEHSGVWIGALAMQLDSVRTSIIPLQVDTLLSEPAPPPRSRRPLDPVKQSPAARLLCSSQYSDISFMHLYQPNASHCRRDGHASQPGPSAHTMDACC